MARMKFLCDADRCIECNACVTACKNENEVPWGINRRRVVTINDGKPGERSVSRWPACTAPTLLARRFARSAVFIRPPTVWFCIPKINALDAVTASTRAPSALPNIRASEISGREAKWINAPTAPEVPSRTTPSFNTKNMVPIGCPRASCRSAPKCVRRNPCSPGTVRLSRRSIRNESRNGGMGQVRGDGKRRITTPSRRRYSVTARGCRYSRSLFMRCAALRVDCSDGRRRLHRP